jgi:hypothetical protein
VLHKPNKNILLHHFLTRKFDLFLSVFFLLPAVDFLLCLRLYYSSNFLFTGLSVRIAVSLLRVVFLFPFLLPALGKGRIFTGLTVTCKFTWLVLDDGFDSGAGGVTFKWFWLWSI